MERLAGVGVSPGVAAGRAVVLTLRTQVVRFSIPARRVERELARLERARVQSRAQLQAIKDRLAGGAGRELVQLFDAQILMLEDSMWRTRATALIREQCVNAEWAVQTVFDDLSALFDGIEDQYLRERRGELDDLVGRLRMNLRRDAASPGDLFKDVEGPCVLIADDLTPSIAAQLDWSQIRGFATDAGGRTYHTAIFARSLGVPAVVGLRDVSRRVAPGTLVVVDGTNGAVTLDAPASLVADIQGQVVEPYRPPAPVEGLTATRDGVVIRIEANVELSADVDAALEQRVDGIGLYRSEFLLTDRPVDELTEDVQYEIYRLMLERMAPRPVTVRTFDIDADQLARRRQAAVPAWLEPIERGRPRLGLRAIRLTLAHRELLRRQLRALLRAACHGDLRIMFPFVSGVEELRQARRVLAEAADELRHRGIDPPAVRVGAMIEVPSAAFTADLLAGEADFLTIGTNDLIQCCLAVDRTDPRVSHLYEPLHPAILRLIRTVRRAAAHRHRALAVCGEMASDPVALALLVGMGLTAFSMAPSAVPAAREVLGRIHAAELRRVAAGVMGLTGAAEIRKALVTALGDQIGVGQEVTSHE